ncbi:hypothetical protein NE865_13977 [Phthorimaea operculella]|nr:hypothetical protein NE865_13977 [Phthorimaea operculella]
MMASTLEEEGRKVSPTVTHDKTEYLHMRGFKSAKTKRNNLIANDTSYKGVNKFNYDEINIRVQNAPRPPNPLTCIGVPVGRPRFYWTDGILKDLHSKKKSDWKQNAQNREVWRAVASEAKIHFGSLSQRRSTKPQVKCPVLNIDYQIDGDYRICCHCNKKWKYSIKNGGYIYRHIQLAHFRPYFCPECNLQCRTELTLLKHKLEAHGIDERLKCNACDAVFFEKVYLTKHMKGFHMLGKLLKCDSCSYETFFSHRLYKHKEMHAERKYKCRYCPKAFKRGPTLDLHEKIHTNDKRKVCKECNKAFVQKASLNYHMTKYHPEVRI